jgi:hypothetical protein
VRNASQVFASIIWLQQKVGFVKNMEYTIQKQKLLKNIINVPLLKIVSALSAKRF